MDRIISESKRTGFQKGKSTALKWDKGVEKWGRLDMDMVANGICFDTLDIIVKH
jgi:hypothetical protein